MKLWPISFLLSFTLFADPVRPTHPTPGEDAVLFKNESARNFFQHRKVTETCVTLLSEKKSEFKKLSNRLRELKEKGASPEEILATDDERANAFSKVVELANECGNCAVQPVEKREIVTPARKEIWYISDGSCQISDKNESLLRDAFQKMRHRLSHVHEYPQRNGGFSTVLDLIAVHPDNGKLMSEVNEITVNPFFSYMAVKGPVVLGALTSFGYYFKTDFLKPVSPVQAFTMNSQSLKAPHGFAAPKAYYVNALGEKKSTSALKVNYVLTQWHINVDGYARYFIAAEFGIAMKFVEEMGQRVLMHSLYELLETAETP